MTQGAVARLAFQRVTGVEDDVAKAQAHLLDFIAGKVALICTGWDRMHQDVPEKGAAIVAIVQSDLLALMACVDRPQEHAAMARAFVPDVAVYAAHRRCWIWSAALAVRMDVVLERMLRDLEHGVHEEGSIAVLLHGQFERRRFPRHLTPAPVASVADSDCRYRRRNSRYADVLRCFGENSLQDGQIGCTPDGLAHYRYNHVLNLIGTGRGVTDEKMRRGALYEYIERWVATLRPSSMRVGSYRALSPLAMHPGELWDASASQLSVAFPDFEEEQVMEWMPTRVVGGEKWLLPLEMVNYGYAVERPITPHRNSNGCAIGSSPLEAAFFATLEVIERDALLLVWYSRASPPRLDLSAIDNFRHRRLIDLLFSYGYRLACFDITNELDVPSILVLASGAHRGQLSDFITAASHPDAEVALHEALSEMKSLLFTAERNHRRSSTDHVSRAQHVQQLLRYGDFEQRRHLDFLRDAPVTLSPREFCRRHGRPVDTLYGAYRVLRRKLASRGYRLIICDTTHKVLPVLGLYAARAFIPGTIPLTFAPDQPWLPPRRLGRAAPHVQWLRTVRALNAAVPHPLG